MRVYISGPITREREYYERFLRAAEDVWDAGYTPVNPAILSDVIPCASWSVYMKLCICILDLCDAIYLLPGWENSIGCVLEKHYAEKRGLEVLYDL